MARGLDWEVEWRFSEQELRDGAESQINDRWRFDCSECAGKGIARNRPCEPCGGEGFVWREYNASRIVKIPAGSRPGRKLRVRGWGYHGNPDTPENRGDRIIVLRLYGDGEMLDELPPSTAANNGGSLSSPGFDNRLTGGK